MAKQPLQTLLQIEFDQVDISSDLLPDLLSFSYDDKETNEADEVSITLKDTTGKWADTWKPNGGETVQAWIIEGRIDGIGPEIYCGKFYVDSLSCGGNPRTVEIKAISIPMNTPIRKKLKSRAWEKQSIKSIAQSIADEAGCKLVFDVSDDVTLDRREQERKTDLGFLLDICNENGYSLKMTDDQIVIFDAASYEKKDPVKTFKLGESNIESWSFESAQSETYKSVTLNYRGVKVKKAGKAGTYDLIGKGGGKATTNSAVYSYTYTDPNAGDDGQEYSWKKRATSIKDAERLAKAKLRELNKRSVTGSININGDVSLVAGLVIRCEGFGSFDGNFIIQQATHTIDGGGYKTALSLRRVNSNY